MARRDFSLSEIPDALMADASAVFQVRRHLQEQGIGNVNSRAPARALIGIDRAKLAVVRLTAKRALSGVQSVYH